ncbi:hypothetical protein [Pareuzebyella sediminis]|uniref:hypothetical protein n=1 Tax=Pareuzebyella sediminis TaxID=2607998 RepID=UPI0011EE8B73|nr:hypothetical protein [Pareuzebyella sediminis]
MKKYFKFSLFAFLLGTALTFIACQKEEPFQEDFDEEQTLTATSATVNLMKRTVANDGSYDNIIDGASCFDIRFPYTVEVNGLEVKINEMEDLETVEKIMDAVDGVEAVMEIFFPITITMADYTELTISGIEELEKLAENCVEGGSDDDIECIDIIYPVTLFTFNTGLQQTGSVTAESDLQMRRFFAGLGENELVSFDFPLSFELYDDTKVTVNTNAELAAAIERAKEACDEDDDNDHNDDDFTEERLDNLLMECPWEVAKLERKYYDNSDQYREYILLFKEEGVVLADNGYGHTMEGHWSTEVSDFRVVLNVEFENAPDFNENWYVYEMDEGKIKLFSGDEDGIVLELYCEYEPEICTADAIRDRLSYCRWKITDQEGSFFEDLNIDFSNNNIHVHTTTDVVVDEGNWSLSGETVTFADLSMTLSNYIGDWIVIECALEHLKLKRGDEIIMLIRDCE